MNLDPRIFLEAFGPPLLIGVALAVVLFVLALAGLVTVAHRATRSRREGDGVPPGMRLRVQRPGLVVAAVVVLGLVLATGTALAGTAPTRAIPVPPRTASPEEVVRAYLDASTAHDVTTMNALVDTGRFGVETRFRPTWVVREVTIYPAVRRAPVDGVALGTEVVEVQVEVTTVKGHDLNFPDGRRKFWGYVLSRASADERWRIVDQGV